MRSLSIEQMQADRSDSEDLLLILQAQKGDGDAFGKLYERYAPSVFRFIYSRTGNRLDAEDLTEDVFLRAWRSISSYQDKGVPLVAYLFRIARNALIDESRGSKWSRNQITLDEETPVIGHHDTAEAVDARLERQEIYYQLDKLREDYKTVLQLRFLGGLSPDEIAGVMGKSVGAVRILQFRALTALKELINRST
jgi:RNA polymerase sigma-70 factor, ECF subfamily